jgi:hypothetical protein
MQQFVQVFITIGHILYRLWGAILFYKKIFHA